MQKIRFVVCLFVLSLFSFGCAKKSGSASNSSSRISFQLPASLGDNNSLGTACFAISITATDIAKISPGSCDNSYGIFSGLAPLGSSLQLDAPFGKARTIDIFYVISENGCKAFDPNLGLGKTFGANKVYRISQTQNVDFDQPEVIVKAFIDYPSVSNSIKTLFNLPASCDKGDTPISLMALKQARVVQGSIHTTTANGSQAHIRVYDQKLNMQSPTNFSGRILPVRLGEEQ